MSANDVYIGVDPTAGKRASADRHRRRFCGCPCRPKDRPTWSIDSWPAPSSATAWHVANESCCTRRRADTEHAARSLPAVSPPGRRSMQPSALLDNRPGWRPTSPTAIDEPYLAAWRAVRDCRPTDHPRSERIPGVEM